MSSIKEGDKNDQLDHDGIIETEYEIDSSGSSSSSTEDQIFLTCNTENISHLPFETTQEVKVTMEYNIFCRV